MDADASYETDHLVRAILAITEAEASSAAPMHSTMGSEGDEFTAMRAEAERDFVEWRKQRRAIKRLVTRNDSTASTASSSLFDHS